MGQREDVMPGGAEDELTAILRQLDGMVLAIGHLAAQLTVTQIRLRALASALESAGVTDPIAVQRLVVDIADHQAGRYLRENLGDEMASRIDCDQVAREIVEFLGGV